MIGIYKITSPSGKVYIGQTTNILSRKSVYRRLACVGQPRLLSSLLKYGWDSHCFEILIVCEKHELDFYEKEFIIEYNCVHPNGLNLKSGGFGNGGHNNETKLKISETKKAMKLKPLFSDSHRAKLKLARKNQVFTDEYRTSLSKSHLGKKQSITTVMKRSKAVMQIDKDGHCTKEYFGVSEASRITGVSKGNISRACKTDIAAGGYYWKYKNTTHYAGN